MKYSLTRHFTFTSLIVLLSGGSLLALAGKVFQVSVKMVMVSFTVKDEHGRYVSGLSARDICLREDAIVQHIESFADASDDARTHAPDAVAPIATVANSVFILFDTSNCMYQGFARAEDEIAGFIRGLDRRQAVAVYSFSHNMSRLTRLTTDHEEAVRALRNAAAGDSTAVLDATLLTLRDAAQVPGRKIVVVFSNGPDDSSMLGPSDVARVAEDEGIPVDIVATRIPDELCRGAFDLLSNTSGGELFLADAALRQSRAFYTIGEDLKHTYTLTYYPEPNPNTGWRHIEIKLRRDQPERYHITARNGYWAHRQEVD